MTTKAEIIAQLKIDHPTIKIGDDEQGYKILNDKDYETTILDWATTMEAAQNEKAKEVAAKANAEAKLAALGLTGDDLKALGL
jgi:hypothetical protein